MTEEPRKTPADAFDRIVEIVAILRSDEGCPWDREQTHESLKAEVLEEAYELLETIDACDPGKMAEELGDLLLLVALHAQIASEGGDFGILDVLNGVNAKLVRRHPHVFGAVQASTTEEVLRNWEAIKRGEAGYESRTSVLDGVPPALPALMAAHKLQRKAARVGFDWSEVRDVLDKVREELREVEDAIDDDAVQSEIGDLLFSVVNLARFVGVDPEAGLRRTNRKFVRRFRRIEELLQAQGDTFEGRSLEELDVLWERAKREESPDES